MGPVQALFCRKQERKKETEDERAEREQYERFRAERHRRLKERRRLEDLPEEERTKALAEELEVIQKERHDYGCHVRPDRSMQG
jgi:hypothetical protein